MHPFLLYYKIVSTNDKTCWTFKQFQTKTEFKLNMRLLYLYFMRVKQKLYFCISSIRCVQRSRQGNFRDLLRSTRTKQEKSLVVFFLHEYYLLFLVKYTDSLKYLINYLSWSKIKINLWTKHTVYNICIL